ncbi:CBS domain-containing protein [Desulfocurvus sp.]|uniref:CBS domain-containing protein n=1 Tax=Desulfocurvus sp. TaxID=2871698 RepID=UPI0025C493A4|nr:CBS domain-containing protein [Desulfocurvus sp.]
MKPQEKRPAPLVITTHANADFDALSAMIAASLLYPEAVLVFPGSQEKNLRHFFIQSAMYLFNFQNAKDLDLASVRTLVLVDTRQRSRVAHVAPALDNPGLTVHAWDHHPDTDDDVPASQGKVLPWGSTATILTHELMARGPAPSADEATFIALGIYEDTGSFTFNSTTPQDFAAAAWLLGHGMDVTVISDLITRDLSTEQIALLGQMLDAAQTHEIRGIPVVVTEISTDSYVNDFALLAHKLLDMENLRVLFALGRMDDRVHLVARSRSPEVDVGRICASFGGGGHASAASASIKDRTLAQVKDELFALLNAQVRPRHNVRGIMSRNPATVDAADTTARAAEIMTRYGLKAAPIVDGASGALVGILEHQIADKAVAHGLGGTPCTEYMMRGHASVSPEAELYDVTEIILGQGQRLVPVVEDERVVGVITRTDLINILIDEPARIPENLLPDRGRERNIASLMRERLPGDLLDLIGRAGRLADALGVAAYAVGGFVRDILLGQPNTDLDLVVEGDGIAFARALAEELHGRVRPHRKFQTAVVVLPGEQHIDVATARLEYYKYPAALPTVELSSIKMDLYRRDFTINALAVQINTAALGRLVDFFGAQRDIKERALRVLHSLSFVEDPTRILRAVRFAMRYDMRIGGQTDRLIKNAVQLGLIQKLSGARLFNEMQLLLEEKNAVGCLRLLRQYKVLRAMHPLLTLSPAQEELAEEIAKVLEWHRMLYQDQSPRRWLLFFMALANGAEEADARALAARFHMSQRLEDEFIALRATVNETIYAFKMWRHRQGPPSELYFLLDKVPLEGVLYFMARYKQEDVRKALSQYLTQMRTQALDISGRDLRDLGLPSGPAYGRILDAVRAAMIDGRANCREDQLALARALVTDPGFRGIEAAPAPGAARPAKP